MPRSVVANVKTPSLAAASLVCLGLASALPTASVDPASAQAGRCPSASGQEVVLTASLPRSTKGRSLVVVERTIWIASGSARIGGHGTLLRVDASSGRVQRVFRLAGDPWSIAFGFGSLWLTGDGGGFDGAVIRIDPRSGRVVSVIRGPRRFGSALAITSDGVWIGGGDIVPQKHPENTLARWVFKIDPHRNAVTKSVRLGATTVIALAGEGRSLWATGWGAVVKLSTSGRVLFQRRIDGAGWWIAPAPGGPWVARPFFGTRSSQQAFRARQLLRVRTSEPRPTIVELAGQPGDVAVTRGAAWTVVGDWRGGSREVVRVDGSGATTSVSTRGIPGLIAESRDGVWVAAQDPNELSKIC
jgi:hypothetical protein